jgi:hypothetical protein
MQVLTETQWNEFFPNALAVYTYENFLMAVAKFPKFCDDHTSTDDEALLLNACKVELSTFLAHMKHESGSLIYINEIGPNTLTCFEDPSGCPYRDEDHAVYPPSDGQYYYGRGPLQLSWNYNYAQFSTVAFNGGLDDIHILLDNPDMVATDGKLAFMSALWFYMYPQSPKPSMHDAILGLFEANSQDDSQGICSGCFGTTTNILNGALECAWAAPNAASRVEYYDEYCTALGADCPQDGKSCDTQTNYFSDLGGGARNMWLEKDTATTNACKITPWVSGYSIYVKNDYKRCVCDGWDPTNADCLVISEECEDTSDDTTDTTDSTDTTDTTDTTGTDTDSSTTGYDGLWTGYDWNDGTV